VSVRADAETLRRLPIFQNCDSVPLQIMAFSSERMTVGLKEQLLIEGQTTDCAYLVLSGSLVLSANGKEIGKAEPGAFLGETAMIGGTLSSLTAEADQLTYVARITRTMFTKVAEEYPDFGETVLRALNARVDETLAEFDQVRDLLMQAKSFSDL
jgi:CRP-like cAMP-binding protein